MARARYALGKVGPHMQLLFHEPSQRPTTLQHFIEYNSMLCGLSYIHLHYRGYHLPLPPIPRYLLPID